MSSSKAPDKTTTTTELPVWAQSASKELLARGSALSQKEMPVYEGQRSANLNGYQTDGLNMAAARAYGGSSEINAGSHALQGTLNGQYLGRDTGTNQYMGAQPTGQNAFMGENPHLQQSIDKAAADITRNYTGAVNSTDATMARAGAFGGSAWQQAQDGNSRNLVQGLQDSATSMRMQNYNQSAGLAENALGRQQQNWQTNAGLADSGLARNQAAFEGERGRQMAGLSSALQYGNQAYTDAAQLQGSGETVYANEQQKLADQQALFNERAQSPYKQLDVLGNSIRGAIGNGSTVSQTGPGANPWAQAAGGAAALYGMLG